MAVVITSDDVVALAPGVDPGVVDAIIPGAVATAILAAPCLAFVAPDSLEAQAAKLILVGAIVRLAGAAGVDDPGIAQEAAGPF